MHVAGIFVLDLFLSSLVVFLDCLMVYLPYVCLHFVLDDLFELWLFVSELPVVLVQQLFCFCFFNVVQCF